MIQIPAKSIQENMKSSVKEPFNNYLTRLSNYESIHQLTTIMECPSLEWSKSLDSNESSLKNFPNQRIRRKYDKKLINQMVQAIMPRQITQNTLDSIGSDNRFKPIAQTQNNPIELKEKEIKLNPGLNFNVPIVDEENFDNKMMEFINIESDVDKSTKYESCGCVVI